MNNNHQHGTRPPHDLQSNVAGDESFELSSHRLGALPLVNRILERMRLSRFLEAYLPARDGRMKVAPALALSVLVRNILLSREPMYGVAEWASAFAPDLLGLEAAQIPSLNDDRVGRALDLLRETDYDSCLLALVTHIVEEFDVTLDQLHNDSTSIRFFGKYEGARHPGKKKGKETLAITFGHSKDHRPDLKQLLFILTVAEDGAVPIHFRPAHGNTTDDRTHQRTWDLLCQLTGRTDFLYVADCKLATVENMKYIAQRGGRFVSVLPATRAEDKAFRQHVLDHSIKMSEVHRKMDDEGVYPLDILSLVDYPATTADGFRVLWYHSTRKADLDQASRSTRIDRTLEDLRQLSDRQFSSRTRLKSKAAMSEAVDAILKKRDTAELVPVDIYQIDDEIFRQRAPGRPGPNTEYVREVRTRFDLSFEIDTVVVAQQMQGDGYFPLITNDANLSAKQVLLAYKKQPLVEKRFAQLKSDFDIASVFLKSVTRIEGLFCVYFIALISQALLEREIRNAMARRGVKSLPLYPEGRSCKAPSARRVIDLFENIQRHELVQQGNRRRRLQTRLAPVQKELLEILEVPESDFK